MSENKREMMKITIETPEHETRVIECHGIAAATIEDNGDKYSFGTLVCGNMSIKDLLALDEHVKDELVSVLEKQIIAHSEPRDILKALLGVLKGE
jgi:hypothetical protein